MARAIEQLGSGLRAGYAGLGMHGDEPGSVGQQVHDGDTLAVRLTGRDQQEEVGNLSVRFLGVDAPEVSFTLPDRPNVFVSLGNPSWEAYLENPLTDDFRRELGSSLAGFLEEKVGADAAGNHQRHAEAAHRALEQEILNDIEELELESEVFRFFFAFAHDVMDGYGRLLCYVNRYEPGWDGSPSRYNERLLAAGMVTPYFIWPNTDPFRHAGSLIEAVPPPGGAAEQARRSRTLSQARDAVRNAREQQIGVFQGDDPLRLLPFEVRILGRREPPSRWVLDLSEENDVLIQPREYHRIPNPEDRLFVSEEFVPLFVEKGWRRQAFPGDGLSP